MKWEYGEIMLEQGDKGMFHCPKNTPEGKKSGITCSMCKTCPYGKAGGKGKEIRELAIWMH